MDGRAQMRRFEEEHPNFAEEVMQNVNNGEQLELFHEILINVDHGDQPAPPLPSRYKVFRLPQHIREKIGGYRAVFVENMIENIRVEALQRGALPHLNGVQLLVNMGLVMAKRSARFFEEMEEIDEEELRLYAWNHLHGAVQAFGGDENEPRVLPESPTLHLPRAGFNFWSRWEETDVLKWAKKIVTNQKHLELIEPKQFTGHTLYEFLDSPNQWKHENWPFGLYIQMKSHLNRVINHRNGYRFEDN